MISLALAFIRPYLPNVSAKMVIAVISAICAIVILYLAYSHGKRVERAEWQIKIVAMQTESDRLISETRTQWARALSDARSQYHEERERSAIDKIKILSGSSDSRSAKGAGQRVDPYLGDVLDRIRGGHR